nr:kinase [Sphingobium sp. Sx8-8]
MSPQARQGPVIAGLCGAQGIGKSTISRRLVGELAARGYRALVIGLDDLYLPRRAREELAATVHPLLRIRGVPGTHDVGLGLSLLQAAAAGDPIALPLFDKATDDRLPRERWKIAEPRPDIILLEGWCVGALPQAPADLREPVNALERREDPDGTWRHFVNDQLAGPYQRLFGTLDMLILLAAPDFEIVATWRGQQEQQLLDEVGSGGHAPHVMNQAEIARFVLHYERITRHILAEMPERADLVLRLDRDRQVIGIEQRP